ncbi:MAG TPA: NAD-dependent epimerase/dehydratase family protein [Armatimonadota bacterium]|nr:NAD-dependent epimerase/dehydratase family protein [Armatimonadota bacterium]
MKVFIAGMDGYLGWALAVYLGSRGHDIYGVDAFLRRKWVNDEGESHSISPIAAMPERLQAFQEQIGRPAWFREGNLCDFEFIRSALAEASPDAIIHFGEQPSAPFSMIDREHCILTHENNMFGTLNVLYAMAECCPSAHLIKLGTMGEYGTPNVDIPEGFFTIEYKGRTDTLPFPRQAGSWYHQTKVHDTNNIMFACKVWGLRSTDLMQGVVYGTRLSEMKDDQRLLTRLDIDGLFGTAVNRFCAEAVIGHPLTPYGAGGQTRSFINIRDSMRCIELVLENPAANGEYRVFNQFTEVLSVVQLAEKVKAAGEKANLEVTVHPIRNPRVESESHYYNPDNSKFRALGLDPVHMDDALPGMLVDLSRWRDRIESKKNCLIPKVEWRESAPGVPVGHAGSGA